MSDPDSQTTISIKLKSPPSTFIMSKGLWYMVLSAFSASFMGLFVKLVGERIPVMEIILFRGVIVITASFIYLRQIKKAPFGNQKGWLILRSIIGLTALICFFYGIQLLPLAEAYVLQYTTPIFTAILASIFLRERTTIAIIWALTLCFIGIVFVAQPTFIFKENMELNPLGIVISIAGAIFSAAAYTTVRKLRDTEHPMVIVFFFSFVSILVVLPFVIYQPVIPIGIEWIWLILIGISGYFAQIFLTLGLHREPAGKAMGINYIQVVFAGILGGIFLGEIPVIWSLVGMVLIFIGALFLTRSNKKQPKYNIGISSPEAMPQVGRGVFNPTKK